MRDPLENLCNVAKQLGCPYAIRKYDGHENTFCVYAINEITGTMFADNQAQEHVADAELHYVQPYSTDYSIMLEKIKNLLLAEGFTEPRITIVNDDNKFIVLQYSCEISI